MMIELIAAAVLAQCDPLPPGTGGCVNGLLDMEGNVNMTLGDVVQARARAGDEVNGPTLCPEIQCFELVIFTLPDGTEVMATWDEACNEGCDTLNYTHFVDYEITQDDVDAGFATWLVDIIYTDTDMVSLGWAGIVHEPLSLCGDVDDDGNWDVNDILFVIANWGDSPSGFADINCDGVVDVVDLVYVVCNHCPPGDPCGG